MRGRDPVAAAPISVSSINNPFFIPKEARMKFRSAWSTFALMLGATLALSAAAQNAPAGGGGGRANPAEQAIEYRKALFTVLARNWTPIGGVMQGRAEYNAATVAKNADRVAMLAGIVGEVFPETSKDGNTKAKSEVWTDKAGFAKAVKDMEDSATALAALVKKDNTNSAAFKAAATKVADSCKGCHDGYRTK